MEVWNETERDTVRSYIEPVATKKQTIQKYFTYIKGHLPNKVRSVREANHALSELSWAIQMVEKELGLDEE